MKKNENWNHYLSDNLEVPVTEFSEDLRKDQVLLETGLFNNLMEGIMITDTSGIIKYINPAFRKITGYGNEALGKTPKILKSGKHDLTFYKDLWSSVEEKGQWKGEIWNKKKNGEIYIQWSTITVVKDKNGNAIYYTAVISDITERKQEEEKLLNDLVIAREVQKGMLSQPISDQNISIEGINQPSLFLGGDMYSWYKLDENKYAVMLIDVMGHGVASSLVSMSIQSLLRGMIKKLIQPELVFNELNKHVHTLYRNDNLKKKYYLTAFYALIDTKERVIHYSSAGHPPGFFINRDGTVTELNIGSVPIGLLPEIEVPTGKIDYEGKAKLILYTDGLIENEQKTMRESIDSLKSFIKKRQNLEMKELLSVIHNSFSEETTGMGDDISIVGATIF